MYLKSIHIKDWRAIEDLKLEFAPGLNVVEGPNESGKSSVREALWSAFIYPSRPRGKTVVAAARPWNTKKKPFVELCFLHGGEEWRVTKAFYTEDSELQKAGRVIAQGVNVQPKLNELLAVEGLSALWSVQGDSKPAGVPADLRSSFAASEAITPGSAWLASTVQERYEEFWTSKRQDPKAQLKQARDHTHEAEGRVASLQRQLEEANELSRETEAHDDELESYRQGNTRAQQRLKAEQDQLRTELAELRRTRERLQEWEANWLGLVEQLKEQWQDQIQYDQRLNQKKEEVGEAPSRAAVERLQHEEEFLKLILQKQLREEVEQLEIPSDLRHQLEEEESRIKTLEGLLPLLTDEGKSGDVSDLGTRKDELEKNIKELQTDVKLCEERLRAHETAVLKRESLLQEHAAARDLCQRWSEAREKVMETWREAEDYQQRLDAFNAQAGEPPDRSKIETLKNRQSYLRQRLRATLATELESLGAPAADGVKSLEEAEQRLKVLREQSEEQEKQVPASSPVPAKLVLLALGVGGLGIGLGLLLSLALGVSLGLGAVLMVATAGIGAALGFGKPAPVAAGTKDKIEQAEKALQEGLKALKCDSLDEARRRSQQAQQLKTQLEKIPEAEPTELEFEDLAKLGREQLATELEAMPARIKLAEDQWQEDQARATESRQAREKLISDNPRRRLESLMDQLRGVVKNHPSLEIEVPQECDQGWVEKLKSERILARLKKVAQERRSQLDALPEVTSDAQKLLEDGLREKQSKLEQLKQERARVGEEYQRRQGSQQTVMEQARKFIGNHPELVSWFPALENLEPQGLSRASSEAQERLQRLRESLSERLETLQAETMDDLRHHDEERKKLLPLLDPEPPDLSRIESLAEQLDEAETLKALPRLQLQNRLKQIPDQLAQVESEWKQAHRRFIERRDALDALLKENPEKALQQSYESLKKLGADPVAPTLELPEQFNSEVLELTLPERGLARDEQAVKLKQLLDDPTTGPTDHPLRLAFEQAEASQRELDEVTSRLHQQVGTLTAHSDLYTQLAEARESLREAQAEQREVELEANGLRMLNEILSETQQALEDELVGPLRDRIAAKLERLTAGRYQSIDIQSDFTPRALVTAADESATLGDLSFGTQEQVAFLSRLCLAELLSENGRHMVVFDDSLVHTDRERARTACELIREASEHTQVILLTCHPEDFESLAAAARMITLEGSPAGRA